KALPIGSVPLVREVIVFPSLDTTVRTVLWYFPPCLERSSVSVLASTCFMLVESQVRPFPVTPDAVPSYFDVVTVSIFEPSFLSPLAVTFTPPLSASRVTVRLAMGDTPVACLDFVVLYFHVPSVLSAALAVTAIANTAHIIVRTFILFVLSPYL